MKCKPGHDGRIIRASLALGTLVASLFAMPGIAKAQFGKTSPFSLELNHVFYFRGDKAFYAKAPDCKEWPDAMQTIDTLRSQGQKITVIKDEVQTTSFIQHAYANRLESIQYVDLETIIIEQITDDKYRIYTGSEPKLVVCGFTEAAYLDKIWVEAGLRGEDVPIQPATPAEPPLSRAVQGLQTAFFGQLYPVVRNSLTQRGYSTFAVPDPVAERCEPTLERLCQTYPEAVYERGGISGIVCTFVFRREGTRQLLGVDAAVFDLTAYTAHIEVTKLRELGEGP